MKSSHRSKLAAASMFGLIAVVVLGGMTWATVSSVELAKKDVTAKRDNRINLAVTQMSSHLAVTLNTETARPYDHYSAIYKRRPVAAFSAGGLEIDAQEVALLSPLAAVDPPKQWMEFFFHIDAQGRLSSPNFPNAATMAAIDDPGRSLSRQQGRQLTWDWLRNVLPGANLHERVAAACADGSRTHTELVCPPLTSPAQVASQRSTDIGGKTPRTREAFRHQKKTFRDSQLAYVPDPACIDRAEPRRARLASEPVASELVLPTDDSEEIKPDVFIDPFWLGEAPDAHQKLVFVREVHRNAAVEYQGFVGDWPSLKTDLLASVENPLPIADLLPVLDVDAEAAESTPGLMFNFPARLKVPDVRGGATAAAWRSVRPTLITMWLAALLSLGVAAFGLRNLVALTERRMQFAYAVTHELRTPLTTFRLYSDMLSAGLVPEDSQKEYLDTLNRESLRLSTLVEGVLEYARLENQRVRLNPVAIEGTALLGGIGEDLQRRCDENGIQANTENTLAPAHSIRTDVDVVTRIAGVLVNNACRHARGHDSASVFVRLGGDNGEIALDVIDTGAGIDRSDARKIFKPFRRGHKADAAAHGGIGLGLALARSWATLLGGRLELAARHHATHGGAHFRLTFPSQPTT